MVPKVTKNDISDALKYIDENGVPLQNRSTKYEIVTDDGKRYPPKYVIAVADGIANGGDISTRDFNAVEAKKYLEGLGFTVETKTQVSYTLVITADGAESNDERFDIDDITLGDGYKPLDVFFENENGDKVSRARSKGEKTITNQTMPRLACQVFEKQLAGLSDYDKLNFPVCKYNPQSNTIKGIFPNAEELKKSRNTQSWEYVTYTCGDGRLFVFYCWNIFSTLYFVQECLKRFGNKNDRFVLTYREKEKKEAETANDAAANDEAATQDRDARSVGYKNPFSSVLMSAKNIIFRGAPGTGKSYLAKEVAADIVSDGYFDDYTLLTDEQKKQIEFVQFHPSYDYSDFVEGLRPKVNDDGSMGFELRDGIFKRFAARARKNYEDFYKSTETREKEYSAREAMTEFFSDIEFGADTFKTVNGNEFTVTDVDGKHVYISIPGNAAINKLTLSYDEIAKMLESGRTFDKVKDVTAFFDKGFATQAYSYEFVLYKEIAKKKMPATKTKPKHEELKKYIFIIDEINRGDISKIFGELFFAIDPSYRGPRGEISTQYSYLHSDPDEKFYVPDNLYIIGTMNDIDRSVDSFDFAMHRRFRFAEIKADDRLEMLDALENEDLKAEAIKRLAALNKEIANVEDLNENYQIGAAYFLKLKDVGFDGLWTDFLKPLLQEYIHGMYDEDGIMQRFAKAYGYPNSVEGSADETA